MGSEGAGRSGCVDHKGGLSPLGRLLHGALLVLLLPDCRTCMVVIHFIRDTQIEDRQIWGLGQRSVQGAILCKREVAGKYIYQVIGG